MFRATVRYYVEVLWRFLREEWVLLRPWATRTSTHVAAFLLGSVTALTKFGWDLSAVLNEFWVFVLWTLVPALALLGLITAWNVVAAPVALDLDRRERIAALESEVESLTPRAADKRLAAILHERWKYGLDTLQNARLRNHADFMRLIEDHDHWCQEVVRIMEAHGRSPIEVSWFRDLGTYDVVLRPYGLNEWNQRINMIRAQLDRLRDIVERLDVG